MPTTLPRPEPSTAARLTGAAILLLAIGLLRLGLYRAGRAAGEIGVRIGG